MSDFGFSERMGRQQVLSLYKNIIRNLESYPSKNRLKIIAEVKLEFRQNLQPTVNTPKLLNEAQASLSSILQYSTLNSNSSHWSVDLEKNPLPKGD